MRVALALLAILAAAAPAAELRSENGVRPIIPWKQDLHGPQAKAAAPGTRYYWAAFASLPEPSVHAGLASLGVEVLGYAGRTRGAVLYKVRLGPGSGRVHAFLRSRPGFLNLLPVVAEEKLASRWYGHRSRILAQAMAEKGEKATVWFHRPLPWPAARALLEKAVDSVLYDPDRGMVHVVASPSRLRRLADLDEVARVGKYSPRAPTNERARTLTGVAGLQAPFLDTLSFPPTAGWNRGRPFTGEGIHICVNEGLDTNHMDFREAAAGGGTLLRRGPADSWIASSHGTHVAGIAAGNGWGSEAAGGRRYQFRGMAPKAALIPYWESGDVNNHSFTNGFEGYYNYSDAGVDERYSDHNGILPDANNVGVWAAANNGGDRPQYGSQRGWYSLLVNAKNPIKVAAADAEGRRASFSSLGPTRDGRIGPDITAPGEAVFSTREGGQGYTWMSGTSMASPQVTGIVALLLQKYQDQVLLPLGLDIHNQPPWNSTVKAVLIHTARDMVDLEGAPCSDANPEFAAAGHAGRGAVYGPGPDFATGYGMIDAAKAAEHMDPARFRETAVSAGQTRTFAIEVDDGRPSLRATLVWDDPPFRGMNDSSGAHVRKLVNDLDLRLVSPSGKVHLPWVLDHAALHDGSIPADGLDPVTPEDILANPARRGRDTLNNVEVVDVADPEAGAWTIEVTGAALAVDQSLEPGMNQDFSLVSDVAPEFPSTASAPDLVIADIAWTPAKPSPQDRVRFRAVLRNAGSTTLPAGTVEVRFHVAGSVVARGEIEAGDLEPDETLEVDGNLGVDGGDSAWTAFSGLVAVSAWADPSDRVAEARETNNARLETLDIPRFPHPWEMGDIGRVGVPGFGYFFDRTFYLTGEGADIWGAADAGNFIHQELAGDGEIRARVEGLDDTHAWAKAGLMFRDGLGAGARNVFVGVTPRSGLFFHHRADEGGPTAHVGAQGLPPSHLRLVRSGDRFTGYVSPDGATWTPLGTVTVPMPRVLRVGMAVTSHQAGASSTGTFGSVEVRPGRVDLPPGGPSPDIGAAGLPGAAAPTVGVSAARVGASAVQAPGAGFPWASHRFRVLPPLPGGVDTPAFMHRDLDGDGEISAKVARPPATHLRARAGLMIREGAGSGARHVAVSFTGSGSLEFHSRTSFGGTREAFHAGAASAVWLRLSRKGDVITAYRSPDGLAWSSLGRVHLPLPRKALIGLSHPSPDAAARASGTFSDVLLVE